MTNGPDLSDFMYILVISKYSSYMICKSVIHNTVVYLTFVCVVVSILRYQSWYHTEVKKLQLQVCWTFVEWWWEKAVLYFCFMFVIVMQCYLKTSFRHYLL